MYSLYSQIESQCSSSFAVKLAVNICKHRMDLEAQLREQAILHGITHYRPADEPSDHIGMKEAQEIEYEVTYFNNCL